MIEDFISEMGYGEGAIRTVGRVILRPTGKGASVIAGAIIPVLTKGDEMWEVSIMLIPTKKYRLEKKGMFDGYRIDQMLTGGYEKPENWADKPYWEKKE